MDESKAYQRRHRLPPFDAYLSYPQSLTIYIYSFSSLFSKLLILTTLSTFPMGGNRRTRRKPTTFGRALTNSSHVRYRNRTRDLSGGRASLRRLSHRSRTDHNLGLGVDFTEGGKPENPEKNPRSTGETNYNNSTHKCLNVKCWFYLTKLSSYITRELMP